MPRVLGVLGGLGPESTIDYYRALVALHRERSDGRYPPLVIVSADLQEALRLVSAGAFAALADFLAPEIDRLARAGAEFGLIAANTPHVIYGELARRSPIPLLSIVETTCLKAQALGLRRLGLLGTGFTMRGRFYPDVFARAGIDLVVPEPPDLAWVHEKYLGELLGGVFLDETRAGLLAVVERLRERAGIDGVILAGTELPLILRRESHAGLPFLDTTQIHVERAVERMLEA